MSESDRPLTDRYCLTCPFYKNGSCSRWNCIQESTKGSSDEAIHLALAIEQVTLSHIQDVIRLIEKHDAAVISRWYGQNATAAQAWTKAQG